MSNIRIAFGNVFKRLRKERGLSQLDIDADYGISAKYQSDIEKGKRNVSLKFVEKAANAFGITVGDMFVLIEEEMNKMQ